MRELWINMQLIEIIDSCHVPYPAPAKVNIFKKYSTARLSTSRLSTVKMRISKTEESLISFS